MSTADIAVTQADTDRIGDWADLVSSAFVPLECRGRTDGFHAVLNSRTAGGLQMTRIDTTALQVARTSRAITRRDPGGFKVVLQLRGSAQLSQDERQAWLQPGDLAIYDTSRQYTITTDGEERFQCFVLMFPVTHLGIPIDAMRRVTCTRIDGRDGLGGLISPFLSRMADSVLAHEPYVDSRLMRNTMDLIETLYRQRLDLAPVDPDSVMRSRLLVVKAWIRRRLSQPDLSPELVAAAHHMSIRYLYRHFEAEGTTVARWIKEQRLEGCRRELAEPSLARFNVSAIAARWGILDPAGFSRSFRAVYGESPRAYRIRHLAGSGDDHVLQSPIQTPLVSVNSSIPAGPNSRPEPLAPKPP